MCMYHLVVWSNFNLLNNYQWTTFPTQSCLVLYSFVLVYCICLLCNLQFHLFLFMVCGWFGWFYGISTFVGYLTPNPFLCKSVQLKTVQFSISTQFNCQKYFHFKLFKQLYVIIQLSVNTVLMSKNSSI